MQLVLCPACRVLVEATSDTVGQMRCPRCQHEFVAPRENEPVVLPTGSTIPPPRPSVGASPISSPSSVVPPPSSPEVIAPPRIVPPVPPPRGPQTSPSEVGTSDSAGGLPPLPEGSAGYSRSLSLTLRASTTRWGATVLLSLALVCTLFPWVGLFVGGSPVYAQGPWGAAFGRVETDPALIEVVQWPTAWVDRVAPDTAMLLPALLLLILAVVLAWADRSLTSVDLRQNITLARLWPWRRSLLLACAAGATVLLFLSVWRGWGLERALLSSVNAQFAEEWNRSVHSPSQLVLVQYRIDQELLRYNLKHTLWQWLGLTSLFTALLALLLSWVLERRVHRPPPRLVFQY